MFAENLKFLREKYKIDQQELAEKLGRKSSSSISEWEKGKYTPKLKTLNEIAKIFNVDIDDLMNIDLSISNQIYNILPIYNQLNDENKVATYEFASDRLEEQKQENVLDFPKKEKIPTVHNSASAANPTELTYGDTVVEEEEFERVPRNADFAVPIIGDSMEPVIRNGQFVFVKEQPDVEDGEIAIVELDGDGVTCKEIYKDYENQTIILRSINDLYEDRIVSPEQIRIIGKVVF